MGCGGSKPAPAKDAKQGGTKRQQDVATPKPNANESRMVLGKYRLNASRGDIMGKGTSSVCHKGVEVSSGRQVAIKLYKEQQAGGGGKIKDTTMQKFRRQIKVLKELMEPFKVPTDSTVWSKVLSDVAPAQVFMQLIDYSQDADGEPAPDPSDGMLYVVTELAQYSLKDFLADRREKGKNLSKDAVRDLSKRMVLAMAALHAKGLVHIDMKPENMMVFDGRLKVIDVDGCVKTGTKVSINDGSISFSPCYCAPEWARFMIKDNEQMIIATPALDVWSVGMTLCELVTLDAIWKPQYANFMRNAHSHREAGFLFLEWLGEIKRPPLPKNVQHFDQSLLTLLTQWFLVCNSKLRKTCAQALDMPYLAEGGWQKYGEPAGKPDESVPQHVAREKRVDDQSGSAQPLIKGVMWKLNAKGDLKNAADWIQRDMWLAHNHSLCYFSQKDGKRLVLIDGEKLTSADVTEVPGTAKGFAIKIESKASAEEKLEPVYLGHTSKEELDNWIATFTKMLSGDWEESFRLGADMGAAVAEFKLAVRNRRQKVDDTDKDGYEAKFKSKLLKLKGDGDRKKEDDWFPRDFFVAKNGSMVYFSPKDERDLVYYTSQDIAQATIATMADGQACQKNVFTVQLKSQGGADFEPGEFSAETPELRDEWMKELKAFSKNA